MRVVIADDVLLVRAGEAQLLRSAGIEVVAECGDAEELLRAVATGRPDVAIIDIRMPPTHTDEGLRAARTVRALYPETGVLLLSQYLEPAYATSLLADAPARTGYLLKERVVDVAVLVDALTRVHAGSCVVDDGSWRAGPPSTRVESLTDRKLRRSSSSRLACRTLRRGGWDLVGGVARYQVFRSWAGPVAVGEPPGPGRPDAARTRRRLTPCDTGALQVVLDLRPALEPDLRAPTLAVATAWPSSRTGAPRRLVPVAGGVDPATRRRTRSRAPV